MAEETTYENILQAVLEAAPEGVDTRQGSIYYDAVAGICYKIAEFYTQLDRVVESVSLAGAVGGNLDEKGSEYGLFRNPAVQARYYFNYVGTTPAEGERFFTNGSYFLLMQEDDALVLQAEEAGTQANDIAAGTQAIPVNNLTGLESATFGNVYEPGVDKESDEEFRQRIRERLATPAENGNLAHYKAWCKEDPGVGRAYINPLWDGENTIKGVLVSPEGVPVSDAVIERVQEYIDPGSSGTGLGVANLGAHFTAVAAGAAPITVACVIHLVDGYTAGHAKEGAEAAITQYLKEMALNAPDDENMVVRIAEIGAIILSLDATRDYESLTLNGEEANIVIEREYVPVLQEVVVNGG